ncbi:hypothetical protein GOV09_06435, partial [Candidatus Woesearchaeota archaeon]|nr:hypothetical protein [Candidatus Woesearchaeota archaeon]
LFKKKEKLPEPKSLPPLPKKEVKIEPLAKLSPPKKEIKPTFTLFKKKVPKPLKAKELKAKKLFFFGKPEIPKPDKKAEKELLSKEIGTLEKTLKPRPKKFLFGKPKEDELSKLLREIEEKEPMLDIPGAKDLEKELEKPVAKPLLSKKLPEPSEKAIKPKFSLFRKKEKLPELKLLLPLPKKEIDIEPLRTKISPPKKEIKRFTLFKKKEKMPEPPKKPAQKIQPELLPMPKTPPSKKEKLSLPKIEKPKEKFSLFKKKEPLPPLSKIKPKEIKPEKESPPLPKSQKHGFTLFGKPKVSKMEKPGDELKRLLEDIQKEPKLFKKELPVPKPKREIAEPKKFTLFGKPKIHPPKSPSVKKELPIPKPKEIAPQKKFFFGKPKVPTPKIPLPKSGLILSKKRSSVLPPPPPGILSKTELSKFEESEVKLERKMAHKIRKEEHKEGKQRLKVLKNKINERENLLLQKQSEEKRQQKELKKQEKFDLGRELESMETEQQHKRHRLADTVRKAEERTWLSHHRKKELEKLDRLQQMEAGDHAVHMEGQQLKDQRKQEKEFRKKELAKQKESHAREKVLTRHRKVQEDMLRVQQEKSSREKLLGMSRENFTELQDQRRQEQLAKEGRLSELPEPPMPEPPKIEKPFVEEPTLDMGREVDHALRMAQAQEKKRHDHEMAWEKRRGTKEQQKIEEEIFRITDFIKKEPLSDVEKQKIQGIKSKIQDEQVALHDQISTEQQRIQEEILHRHAEVQRAIQRIKEDHLTYKPRDLVLKQEHLAGQGAVYGEAEHIMERIADAREEMMRLHLESAKQIYVELMREYLKLQLTDKRKVYPELAELYSERKKTEAMFTQ